MSTVTLATSSADVEAVTAVEQHHAELAGALNTMVDRLVTAASHDDAAADRARRELVGWCRRELLPHARAEEEAMYPAAHRREEARLLVSGMLAEHEVLAGLVDELDAATDPVRAAAAGTALKVLFASHLHKENDLLLPVLAADPEVSLADLLAGMHELLGGEPTEDHAGDDAEEGHGAHRCGCGEETVDADPELDARVVPHAIRHATIFGALDAVTPGSALILLAPHDPIPLLAQVEQRHPGAFAVEYLERGPETWRLRFRRRASRSVS
jgi:uncharacterized protein (DUF2249 family)/iron-sulfur cluster repair protein YtfE (RIC family)